MKYGSPPPAAAQKCFEHLTTIVAPSSLSHHSSCQHIFWLASAISSTTEPIEFHLSPPTTKHQPIKPPQPQYQDVFRRHLPYLLYVSSLLPVHPSPDWPPAAKQSWRGCGSHLPSVFANVPEDQWCTCEPKNEVDGKAYPPAAKVNLMPKMEMPSFLKSWVGGKAEEKGEAKK
jgi:hypothetical protein